MAPEPVTPQAQGVNMMITLAKGVNMAINLSLEKEAYTTINMEENTMKN